MKVVMTCLAVGEIVHGTNTRGAYTMQRVSLMDASQTGRCKTVLELNLHKDDMPKAQELLDNKCAVAIEEIVGDKYGVKIRGRISLATQSDLAAAGLLPKTPSPSPTPAGAKG